MTGNNHPNRSKHSPRAKVIALLDEWGKEQFYDGEAAAFDRSHGVDMSAADLADRIIALVRADAKTPG